jgi:MFS family permease
MAMHMDEPAAEPPVVTASPTPATSLAEPPQDGSIKRLPFNVKLLGLTSLLNDSSSEMIFPLLPQFVIGVLHGTAENLGQIEGVADTVASLLKLWSGGWSDRAGRRRGFVIFGYGMATFARPLVALATSPWHVLAARTGDRIGKGVRGAPRDALIADSTPPGLRGRAFGFHRAMDHLGAAIGPVLASVFLYYWPGQMRPLFLLSVVPGLLIMALLLWKLREPAQAETHARPFSLSLRPFDNNFKLYLLALVIFTLGNSSDAFLLLRAGELGVAAWLLPLLWCAFHIAKSVGNLLLGRLVDQVGPRPLIVLGWLLYAGIYVAFAAATQAWHVWLFFMVYALFYALTEPAEKALVANIVGAERKGLAYGWYNFAIGIATLPANLIFGKLYTDYGGQVAFGFGAGLALVSAVMLLGVRTARIEIQSAG